MCFLAPRQTGEHQASSTFWTKSDDRKNDPTPGRKISFFLQVFLTDFEAFLACFGFFRGGKLKGEGLEPKRYREQSRSFMFIPVKRRNIHIYIYNHTYYTVFWEGGVLKASRVQALGYQIHARETYAARGEHIKQIVHSDVHACKYTSRK